MLKKILWAMDGFGEQVDQNSPCLASLKLLSSKGTPEIEPVHVLSPSSLDLSVDFKVSQVRKNQQETEEKLKEALESINVPGLTSPRVLVNLENPSQDPMEFLARYAEQVSADVILICSHGRSGIARLLLGSTAEHLILNARVPVLVVSQKIDVSQGFKEMVFASDLSADSRKAFGEAVRIAKALGTDIVVFCREGGRDIPEADRLNAQQFVSAAEDEGVTARAVIEPASDPMSVSDAIITYSSEKPGRMIAMSTAASSIDPKIGVSIAQQVVEKAGCPIWVIHGRD